MFYTLYPLLQPPHDWHHWATSAAIFDRELADQRDDADQPDRATVRSLFLYRAATDKFFSGFRRLQCHAAEESGDPSSILSTLAALSAAFFFAARAAGEAGKRRTGGTPRALRVVTCCLIISTLTIRSRHHPARLSTRRKSAPPIMTPFHSIATD
jgi:hypothetical protein